MFEVDLRILTKMTEELQACEARLRKESEALSATLQSLGRIEMKGMEPVRRDLQKRQEELGTQIRRVRSMRTSLQRICECYRQAESRAADLFEASAGTGAVWQAVRLSGIKGMLP